MGRRRRTQKQPKLTTADHLAQAIHDNQLPQHPATCEVYGFNRAPSIEDKRCLLRLYAGAFRDLVNERSRHLYALLDLVEKLNISPKAINDWRNRRVLVGEIEAAFHRIPEDSRGLYFPWFLQNEHVIALAGKPLSEKEIRDNDDAIWRRAWLAIGGSERASYEEIQAAVFSRPEEEVMCYTLYMALLSACPPSSHFVLWIEFGFASCTSEEEECALYGQYQRLITLCTFDEFCAAHRNNRLLGLFHFKGLQPGSNAYPRNLFLGNPEMRKDSVWLLKKFILHGPSSTEEFNLMMLVILDYGLVNCRNPDDWQQLRKVYKDFFTIHRGDAMTLYEACMEGNLYGFLSNAMPGLPPRYQRLLAWHPHSFLSPLTPSGSWYSTWLVSPIVMLGIAVVFGIIAIYWMRMRSP